MSGLGKVFDINTVLLTAYASLESVERLNEVELIYDMAPTLPRELRGDETALSKLLTHMLSFIVKNTQKSEIVLSLFSTKVSDKGHKVTFEMRDPGLSEKKLTSLFKNEIEPHVAALNAEIFVEEDNPLGIHFTIPFQLSNAKEKRSYRLPDIAMLGKKVLVLCHSQNQALSLKKMFKYFLYEVDIGLEEYKENGSLLGRYDIVILEDTLVSKEIELLFKNLQNMQLLKYVVLHNAKITEKDEPSIPHKLLVKPVVQESILDLIISLFKEDIENRVIKDENSSSRVDLEAYIDLKDEEEESENSILKENAAYRSIEEDKPLSDVILDSKLGEENFNKVHKDYKKGLKEFLETFDGSDKYFREIVSDKAVWQIKEFCIDLEKNARFIGALQTADLAARVGQVFAYDQLDTLPIYPGKYHKALESLRQEIKAYL